MARYIVNPLFLFLAVWTGATVLYLTGVSVGTLPPVRLITLGTVLINVGTFSLGYLTWTLLQQLTPEPAGRPLAHARRLTPDRTRAVLRFTLCMGLTALALGFYRIAAIASHANTAFLDLLTQPGLLRIRIVQSIRADIFQTSHMVMLLSLTSSLFSLGFVLLGVHLYCADRPTKYGYLAAFLTVSLLIGLTNLSRYEVTVNIVYTVFAYCLLHARDRHGISRRALAHLLIPALAAVILFVLIDLLLAKGSVYGRANRLQGFFFSLYWYLASPLAAFNEFLANFDHDYRLGETMFFPFYKWLCRFGLAGPSDFSLYGEMTFIPHPANVYTYMRNFYEDFGMLGVIVAPYALGAGVALVQAKARRCFHFLNLYLVLLALILFSFYNYFLISNQIYLQIFFGFVLFRYELPSPHERRL